MDMVQWLESVAITAAQTCSRYQPYQPTRQLISGILVYYRKSFMKIICFHNFIQNLRKY